MNALLIKYKDQIIRVLKSTLLFSIIYLTVTYFKDGVFNGRVLAVALLLGFMLSLFLRILFSALAKREVNETKKK
jgi:hypothetical protein